MALGSLVVKIVGDASSFNKTIAATQAQLNKSTKGLQIVAKSMTTIGDSMVKGITLPIIAIGAGLLKLGTDFDDAYDKIRVGTGKTGKELEAINNDFKAVAKVAPSSFDDISTAVTGLNQKLGLTGKPLQNLSTQILNLSRITKTDLNANIDNAAKLFNNWEIATENQSETLDLMFRAAQDTGIGIDQLMSSVTDFGPILRAMGYDLENSTALIAGFDEAGVDVSTTIAGMKKALVEMAKEGFTDPQEVLAMYIEKIKGAKTEVEAIGIAAELFGARGGASMAIAIREGRLNLDDLVESLKNGTDGINAASDATMDWKEKLILLRNNIGIALEPLATKVFDAIGRGVDKVTPKIESLAKWFGNLSPEMQDSLIQWAAIAAVIPIVVSGIGRATTGIIKFRNALLTMNTGLATFAIGGSGMAKVLATIVDNVGKFGAVGIPAFDMFLEQLGLYKSAGGELNHIVHEMQGELIKLHFNPGFGPEGVKINDILREQASNIQNLAQIISTESPEAQTKAMALFQTYKDGTITIDELEKQLGKLSRQYSEDATAVNKAKLSTDDYKQSLIDQGYTVEKATEMAKEHAEGMGYVVDAEGNVTEATEEGTGAIEDQTTAIEDQIEALNKLYDSLFDNYLLNADITAGLKEATQRYNEYTEAVKIHGAESDEAKEKEEEWIRTLDMLTSTKIPDLINKVGLLTDEEIDHLTVMKDQIDKAHELGIVSDEEWTNISRSINQKITESIIPDYQEMYRQGQIISDQIIEPEIKVDTGPATTALAGLKNLLDQIKSKSIVITSSYAYSTVKMAGGGIIGYDKGGIADKFLSATQGINLPKFDNGGVLAMLHPPEIVLNAKEAMQLVWNMANKPIDTKQGRSINNTYNITSPKPLTESEIKRQLDLYSRELGYRTGLI